MQSRSLRLRPYVAADEHAAIELWRRTWMRAYAGIDFNKRVDWWRERWRNELVPNAQIVIAETDGVLEGFVTIDPKAGYLDQIVVAPEFWGGHVAALLMDEAKRVSPTGIELLVNTDNARAVRFYEKHGFKHLRDETGPSGRPLYRMGWRP
jgi:putative acetyltransferase